MLWEDNYLAHYGIKGQKWGVRRFQDEDGTYTPAGRERYGIGDDRESKKFMKLLEKSNHYGNAAQKAKRKLLKSKKMQELLNDQQLQQKRSAYKKAYSDYLKESKGEDYDAYNEEDNDYGITPKQFDKIQKLYKQRFDAYDELNEAVKRRVNDFVGDYGNHSSSNLQMNKKFNDDNQWLSSLVSGELIKRR